MTKAPIFKKLHETLSNQNKFWNNDKQEYKPYQICWQETFKMGVHTAKWRLPINTQVHRNRGDWGGAAAHCPQIFAKFYFSWLKKVVLKSKIVQNYKTSWNFSKFINIYNIVTDLDTRDGILIVLNSIKFSHF